MQVLNGLAHAFDTVQILDERNFYKHHGVDAWTALVRRVFVFNKLIYKIPVDGLVNLTQ